MTTSTSTAKPAHIGIIGGGITGLTAAFYLLRAGLSVTILEARPQVGGLTTYFDFGSFQWDKFYHCILTSDRPLLQLIEDLKLSDEMRWRETKVGFYADEKLYSMSSTADFLRFPPLSLWEKFRLGLGVIYASRIRDGRPLESIPVSDWLKKVFGRTTYQKIWEPLLKCKLGSSREEASAAFIWATIFRLYSTRDRSAGQKERLGYVNGGYRAVFSRMVEEIRRMGGQTVTGEPVQELRPREGGGVDVRTNAGTLFFDAVIATSPSKAFANSTPELPAIYRQKLNSVKYLGIVCMALVLKRPMTRFYCTNLIAQDIPFTGVIEMTNLIGLDQTQGKHLVYLPKYTPPDDPLFDAPDHEIAALFMNHFKRMFPDLQESEIERQFIFRERFVQPIPVLKYSAIVPSMDTGIPDLYLANTAQIINSTLNNNAMVKIALEAVQKVLHTVSTKERSRELSSVSQ